jgi:hypothetical protein
MGTFVAGLICNAMMACGPANVPPPNLNPGVTVYRVDSHPAVTQLTLDQISNIGLNCGNKDQIISILEARVGTQPTNPEQLAPDQRRLNSVARSKIWQLRTYCQSAPAPVRTEQNLDYGSTMVATGGTQTIPERRSCRTTTVNEYNDGRVSAKIAEQCVEESAIQMRAARIGDLVRPTEVAEHPVIPQEFAYKGTTCRWYYEPGVASGSRDITTVQGIICQVRPAVWRIIDKF